ncbi:recombinase family protein [Novosphingobium sp. KN65.2]|uniref:recombinase family protein n=1 Tax=Novosphingobium sp. KN65.2 TaxID=1478134 RepID=UPI0005E0385A|nr:recombinase family protein [Novosphingobium sp. KN65.2]CDO38802.1 hypothetical protein SPHV1_760003 [Novosphingobium sp. KN65.2]
MLRAAGAERIWEDHGVSGSAVLKPAFMDMLACAKPRYGIIIWRLDRLSRSLVTLIAELETLAHRRVEFCSVEDGIATSTGEGRGFFNTAATFAKFGQDVLAERAAGGALETEK